MYVCIYIYIYIHICIKSLYYRASSVPEECHLFTYTEYVEREIYRERDRQIEKERDHNEM